MPTKFLRSRAAAVLLLGAVFTALSPTSLRAQSFEPVPQLYFTKPFNGADPLPQTLSIASTGAAFNFSAVASTSSGGNWLAVTGGGCGNNCATTPHVLFATVSADPVLAVGTYTGQIVVTASNGSTALTIPVTLTVSAQGSVFLDNLPGATSFFSKLGSPNDPPAQSVQVRNGGAGSLSWTLTTSTADGGNWLTASAISGTAPSWVDISVSKAALPNGGLVAGTFVGQLLFQTTGSSVTVPVSFVLGSNVFNQLNPISFTKPYTGLDPLPQTLAVSTNGSSFGFTGFASTGTGGNWLSVTGGGCGDNCASTPHIMTATITTSPPLAAATYTGQIVFVASDGSSAMTVPVYFTVAMLNSSFLDNFTGQLSFTSQLGSSTDAPAQTIQIRNGGTGALNWTLQVTTADGGNWLTASASSGTAPSVVTVSVSKAALPDSGLLEGTFNGELLFDAGESRVTVPVSFVVAQNAFTQTNGISFTKLFAGANPLSQTLTFASTDAAINFTAYSATGTGGNWLTLTGGGCGDNCATTPHVLTATVNAGPTLPAGTYTAEIVVSSGAAAITVPVTLTVGQAGTAFFDNVPGQMSFSFPTAAANPPSQSVQLRNAGSGALNWTLTTITADGGNWLSASVLSGTAPSNVNISVDNSALPNQGLVAGTFTGELVFTSASSSVTIPVSVSVGDSVFTQLPALTFNKPFGGANPVSQSLNVTSTNANFSFTAYGENGYGGNWLSLTGGGCGDNCGTTPHVLTAAIAADPSLPAGAYTGQVVVTKSDGSESMTVPILFTVTDQGAPVVTVVAGNNQTAAVNVPFTTPLKVQITNQSGPLGGVQVTFSVPANGATGLFMGNGSTVVVTTDSNGFATAPALVANGAIGSFRAEASVPGPSGAVTAVFSLANTNGSCLASPVPATPIAFSKDGGTQTLSLSGIPASCVYGVVTDGTWVNLSGSTVAGGGSVTVTVASYAGFVVQNATLVVGAEALPIKQAFTAQEFTDVPPSAYYFDAVNLLKGEHVTNGCGATTYCPVLPVTRDQMAVFLVRIVFHANDDFTYNPVPYFTDVPTTAFGFKWIQKLYELGITHGCGPTTYCPGLTVTRDQMAVFIIRARYGANTTFTFPNAPYFTDVPPTAFGYNWIQRMKEDNITTGCSPTTYCPSNPVVRGDMAIFIMRGGFNQLFPSTEPLIASVAPATIAANSSGTFTVTGTNTHFAQGATNVVSVGGLTASNVTVTSPSQFTVILTAGATPSAQPASMYVTTGTEEAVLPNAITETAQ